MIAADLFCGLGGWTDGLLATGWKCRGYDIEKHEYGDERYPGEFVQRDILQMHGSELKDVDLIVSSSPCTEYSYMAMPWSRAKQIEKALLGYGEFPPGYRGSRTLEELNALFNAQFRIQREASEAAGRKIPMVVENVRGAQKWVGRAMWNYGSYYLWGDVPLFIPDPVKDATKRPGRTVCCPQGSSNPEAVKDRTGKLHWQDEPMADGRKNPGFRFDGSGRSFQSESVDRHIKAPAGTRWFNDGPRTPDSLASMSSKSSARKAASARIAKIPFALSSYVGEYYRP